MRFPGFIGGERHSRWQYFSIAVFFSLCLLSIVLVFSSSEQTSASEAYSLLAPTPTPQSPISPFYREDSLTSPQKSLADGVGGVYQNHVAPGRGYSLKGLTAEYYDERWLEGALVASEIVTSAVDFYLQCFGQSVPFAACKLHTALTNGGAYSVRWSGYLIVPETGLYTFTAHKMDDAMRMYLDGELILKHNWRVVMNDIHSATRWLEAGAHWIELEYTQNAPYVAELRLLWSGPGFDTEIIPAERSEGCNTASDCCLNSACCASNEVGGEINTQSGVHNYAVTDLRIAGIGEGLAFRRTYASSIPMRPARSP